MRRMMILTSLLFEGGETEELRKGNVIEMLNFGELEFRENFWGEENACMRVVNSVINRPSAIRLFRLNRHWLKASLVNDNN